MIKIRNYHPTLLCLMILIAVLACLIKLLVLPGFSIIDECNSYPSLGGVECPTPFWPQFWRRLRRLPEPSEPKEIVHSDDGGLIITTIVAISLGGLLAYKFKKYLIKRV